MTQRQREAEFQTKYSTTSVTGPAVDDVLVVENSLNGQVSEIDVTGADEQDWALDTRDNSSTNDTRVKNWTATDIERGSFEDPVVEFGAGREAAVRAVTTLTSGSSYSVNLRVDEHRVE